MFIQSLSRRSTKRLPVLIFFVWVSYFIALSANASENTDGIEYARLGEKIRQNQINVGDIYSVSDKNGRFHIIHADKLLLDCSHCHASSSYRADYLIVSKNKTLPPEHRGHIEKSVCLGCHQSGGMGTPWYTGSTKKED